MFGCSFQRALTSMFLSLILLKLATLIDKVKLKSDQYEKVNFLIICITYGDNVNEFNLNL